MAHKRYSTHEVAAELGCSRQTVVKAAKRLGIGEKAGVFTSSPLMFNKAELDQLRKTIRPVGNPSMVAGDSAFQSAAAKHPRKRQPKDS
jgi:hypothetical protein